MAEWERGKWPAASSTLHAWLNEGLRWAVSGGDVARVEWWVAVGADLHHHDAKGDNAIQRARTPEMLDWLLVQGVSTDGTCRHGGRVACSVVRWGRYEALRCLQTHGLDMEKLDWPPLHRLVALGTAKEVGSALQGPDGAALRMQLEVRDG